MLVRHSPRPVGLTIVLLGWTVAAVAWAQPVVTGVTGGAQGLPQDVAVPPGSIVGSIQEEWVIVTGQGFGPDAVARLQAPGVDATITSARRLRRLSPSELWVRATVGTEADEWTVTVTSGGQTSEPFAFWVVPPRPVVHRAEVVDGGVRRAAYAVRLLGPAFADDSEVLVAGQRMASEPVRSSPYPGALTIGIEVAVPAEAFRDGRAMIQVRTPGAAGGGVSEPVAAVLPPVPWLARPSLWLSLLAGLGAVGLVLYRGGVRHARERAERTRLEAEVAARTAEIAEQAAALREAAEQRAHAFAGITHDLRTPLSVVLASLDGVASRDGLQPDDRTEIEAARGATDQLLRLSASLSEAARHEAGRFSLAPVPVDVAVLACDVSVEHAVLFDRLGLSVRAESTGAAWAQADAWAVRRIVTNLLDNAARFTPLGGEVVVAVVAASAADTEGHVEITVRDTGPGFDSDFVQRAFEPYVQGARAPASGASAREGVGLGLSVVRDLTERMGGGVRAEPGPGGMVVVTLPAVRRPEAEAHPPGPRGDTSRPLVLIAEDDAELREVLGRVLGAEFEVEGVADGQAAFEAARRLRPSLVVSDVVMPTLGGLGLVRALRAEPWGEAIPVVLVTALAEPDGIAAALAAGADDYVAKPFDRVVLLARVRRLIGGRSVLAAPTRLVGPGGEPLSPDDARLVEAVRSAVESGLSDPALDVAALGRAVGLGKAQLGRRLRDALDESPAKYIERLRMDHAAGLLRPGGRLVKEVAGMVGYRDVKTFGKAFKRHYGVPPSAWGDDSA